MRPEIGEISGAAEAKNRELPISPVEQRHGDKGNSEQFDGLLDVVELDAGYGAECRLVVENVGKDAPDDAKCFFVAVNRKRGALTEIERSDVIEAENVVGMAVGEQKWRRGGRERRGVLAGGNREWYRSRRFWPPRERQQGRGATSCRVDPFDAPHAAGNSRGWEHP